MAREYGVCTCHFRRLIARLGTGSADYEPCPRCQAFRAQLAELPTLEELEAWIQEVEAQKAEAYKKLEERREALARLRGHLSVTKERRSEATKAIRILRDQVIGRDGMVCGLCGKEVAEDQVSIDHVLPISLGGTDDLDNLQVAHRGCNSRKGWRIDAA
jgi:5-methylcytosine-specific restriction endonuclease McrA